MAVKPEPMKHTLALELELVKETHKSSETRVKMLKQAIERKSQSQICSWSTEHKTKQSLNRKTNQYLSRKPVIPWVQI